MRSTKSSDTAINNVLDGLQQQMQDKNSDIQVNIGRERMDIINPYVLLFYDSLYKLIEDFKLSTNDIKALLKMLEYMQYGNLVRMSYAKLARDIGIDPKNINKTIKKLKSAKILIEVEDNVYLNPQVIAKGKFKRKDEIHTKILEEGAKSLQIINLEPNILTPKLREQKKIKEQVDLFTK